MTTPGFRADWPAPPWVRTWQTTRAGGLSTGTYASLNLGLHVGDESALVAGNRESLRAVARLPEEPVWLEQVHGRRILDSDSGDRRAADGAVTSTPNRVLAVMTADCLPILLTDRHGRRVGVAHAGWRGLAGGVIAAAVDAMAVEPRDILAWLGPAISQAAFEVGDEVRAAFLAADGSSETAFAANANGRWQADLYALARIALERAGVAQIFGQVRCTYADAATYFSHRREAPCGRMATLIWLAITETSVEIGEDAPI